MAPFLAIRGKKETEWNFKKENGIQNWIFINFPLKILALRQRQPRVEKNKRNLDCCSSYFCLRNKKQEKLIRLLFSAVFDLIICCHAAYRENLYCIVLCQLVVFSLLFEKISKSSKTSKEFLKKADVKSFLRSSIFLIMNEEMTVR